jgi:hypothetical protein
MSPNYTQETTVNATHLLLPLEVMQVHLE